MNKKPAIGLQSQIWNNNFKSVLLLAGYPFILGGLLFACAAAFFYLTGAGQTPTSYNAMTNSYEPVAGAGGTAFAQAGALVMAWWPAILTVVALWFLFSFFMHGRMIRSMAHAHTVTRTEEPALYNLFENLCIANGMTPMPKLQIIETHARNAFASGLREKDFTVTVTRGLLQSLSKDEVEGVLAHELTHILNRDVRLMVIALIFTGMIGFAAQLVWSNLRYGLWLGGNRNSNRGGGSMILFLAIGAILAVGYAATILTRFAISRRREYMADAGAVQMTRNPDAMMRALIRIAGSANIPKIPQDIKALCFENRAGAFMGLFATHPPIEKRIQAIAQTTASPVPALPQLSPMNAPRTPRAEALVPPAPRRDNWATRQRFKNRRSI